MSISKYACDMCEGTFLHEDVLEIPFDNGTMNKFRCKGCDTIYNRQQILESL